MMDLISVVQDNGWMCSSDNWYSSCDILEVFKWSEFSNEKGKLCIDIKEVGGGVMIDYMFIFVVK